MKTRLMASCFIVVALVSCGSTHQGQSTIKGRPSVDGVTAELKRIFDSATKINSPELLSRVPMGEWCFVYRIAGDTASDPMKKNFVLSRTISKVPFGQGFLIEKDLADGSDTSFFLDHGDATARFQYAGALRLNRARLTQDNMLIIENVNSDKGNYAERYDSSPDLTGFLIADYMLMTGRPVDGKCPAID